MASKPAGLGESTATSFVLSREEHVLPGTRKEIIARVETLLSQGGVQKMVLELGKPIRIDRLVDSALANGPMEPPPDELLAQVRNGRMEELIVDRDWSPYQVLFHALHAISQKKLRPAALYCKNFGQMRKWLKLDTLFDLTQVCGVDANLSKDMPDDAFIIAAVSYDELNTEATLGLRVPMDIKE